ncbi:MAG: CvpA family protein [Anaerotignaceae bacterium]
MNYFDLAIVVALIIFAFAGYRKGLVGACMGFVSTVGGLVGTYYFYPILTKILRGTIVYDKILEGVSKTINLEGIMEGMLTSSEAIFNLELPEFLKTSLLENNNPVVYGVLGVNKVEEYIVGYISNICLNILCMIIVYILIVIVIKVLIITLDIVTKLPGLNLLNKTGGLVTGVVKGVIVIWVINLFLVFFYSNDSFRWVFEMINTSKIAILFYEKNILLFMILRIFA